MGALWEDTRVTLMLADYAAADSAGKFSIIGAGYSIAGWDPAVGATAPMHVVIILDIGARHVGQQFTFEVLLRDMDANAVVSLPTGVAGQSQALRFAQNAVAERPVLPGVHLPNDLPSRAQTLMSFPNGLPLIPGHHYEWQLRIDTQRRTNWTAPFYVAEPAGPPTFGGLAGDERIAGIEHAQDVHDEEVAPPDQT